jgi:hypothetical protein
MTEKKQTPISAAKLWARQHPNARGIIAIEYLTPKGQDGRCGMTIRRDHYLVQGGQAAKLITRTVTNDDGAKVRVFNGYCYRCHTLHLAPILRARYLPNPQAGQPVENRFMPAGTVFAPLGQAALCPNCAENLDVLDRESEHVRRQFAIPGLYTNGWMGGGTAEHIRDPLVVLTLEAT